MEMEVSEIAAIVSFNEVKLRQNMLLKPLSRESCQERKYKTKSELVFELVESSWLDNSGLGVVNPLKPQDMFYTTDDHDSFPARDMFWKILRSFGCNQVVHLLASVLYELVESSKVRHLVHRGEKIVNILVANVKAMDVSDIKYLEPTIIVPENFIKTENTGTALHGEHGDCAIPLFSTYSDKRSLYHAGLLVGIDLGASADHLKRINEAETKQIEQILQIERDCLVPHWWLCLITETRKMVHIDLCGPAYEKFEYENNVLDVSSGEYCGVAPIHIFETDEYLLMRGEGKFSHKLAMRNVLWPNFVRQLPPGIRHFNSVNKGLPILFTPLETYLAMNDASPGIKMRQHWKSISDLICNVHCLGKYLQPGVGIKVILNDKPLVGKVTAREAKQNKKIIIRAKVQGLAETVTIDCSSSSVSLFPPPFKPFKSLEVIHAEIEDTEVYCFAPECRVIINGLKSEEGMALNGCEAIVIRDALVKPPPYGETRWKVQLVKSKEIKSIAGKNLKRLATCDKKLDESEAQRLLKNPLAQEFLQHMRLGNSGFTIVCDPKYRDVVKGLLESGLLPNNRMFEEALKIADHPRGESFRQLMVRMKSSGVDPKELEDPDYDRFLKILTKWGLFRSRSS